MAKPVTVDLKHVVEQLSAIDEAAKSERKTVDDWYNTYGPLKLCPYEYKESGTTRNGYILEGTAKILSETLDKIKNGNFTATTKKK